MTEAGVAANMDDGKAAIQLIKGGDPGERCVMGRPEVRGQREMALVAPNIYDIQKHELVMEVDETDVDGNVFNVKQQQQHENNDNNDNLQHQNQEEQNHDVLRHLDQFYFCDEHGHDKFRRV
jgi:hypothetical protein